VAAAAVGFCDGVTGDPHLEKTRAQRFGARRFYVRHRNRPHNSTHPTPTRRRYFESLKGQGRDFVVLESLDQVPETPHPVGFSAHCVPRAVAAQGPKKRAARLYSTRTCPWYAKVHRMSETAIQDLHGRPHSIFIRPCWGTRKHRETLVQMNCRGWRRDDIGSNRSTRNTRLMAADLSPPDPEKQLAFLTPTTLSGRWTRAIFVTALAPPILPKAFAGTAKRKDICYATSNLQDAVKAFRPAPRWRRVVES